MPIPPLISRAFVSADAQSADPGDDGTASGGGGGNKNVLGSVIGGVVGILLFAAILLGVIYWRSRRGQLMKARSSAIRRMTLVEPYSFPQSATEDGGANTNTGSSAASALSSPKTEGKFDMESTDMDEASQVGSSVDAKDGADVDVAPNGDRMVLVNGVWVVALPHGG